MIHHNEAVTYIALTDAQVTVRKGIATLISSFGGFVIDLEASSGEDLILQLTKAATLPDICVLDIVLPGKNGYEILKEIKRRWPDMNTLVLTAIDNVCAIELMLRTGACGHALKNSPPEDLKKALTAITDTGYYYSEPALRALHPNTQKITDRELRFLPYCCTDHSYEEIAKMMHLSVHTVHGYHDSLSRKLKVKSRGGLATLATSMGFRKQH